MARLGAPAAIVLDRGGRVCPAYGYDVAFAHVRDIEDVFNLLCILKSNRVLEPVDAVSLAAHLLAAAIDPAGLAPCKNGLRRLGRSGYTARLFVYQDDAEYLAACEAGAHIIATPAIERVADEKTLWLM